VIPADPCVYHLYHIGCVSSRALSSRSATSTSWLRTVGVPTISIRHDDYQRLSTANVVYDEVVERRMC
jgi:hypothetical protein